MGEIYFSQNYETRARQPTTDQIESNQWDQLYHLYVQRLAPKTTAVRPHRYSTPAYQNYKSKMLIKRNNKALSKLQAVRDDDSSSGDDEADTKDLIHAFYDKKQLDKMQLDDITSKRTYIVLNICNPLNKHDDNEACIVEESIAEWPHQDVMYQYLMDNILLKQHRGHPD